MRSRTAHGEKGMTVVELSISLGIFVIVLLAIALVFDVHNALFASGESKVDIQYSARFTMAQMTKQIRMAGYYPENFDTNPANDLVNPAAIQVATDTALAIFGDDDGNGTSNVSVFCRTGTSVMRATTVACNQGQVLGRSITDLRFAYFNNNNAPIATPVGAAQLGTIQSIVITLTAQENVPGQQAQRYTLTSDVRLRNRNS